MKKTVQVAAIATALSGMVISPLFASAEGEEPKEESKSINYGSEGVVAFKSNDGGEPTPPVDPTDPDPEKPVNPIDPVDPEDPNKPGQGTGGPLSLDFASSLNFGTNNKITTKDVTYYANAQKIVDKADNSKSKYVPNYVQISDNRGTNAGWKLTVKQEGQFSNDDAGTLNKTLKGAVIKFSDPKISGQTGTEEAKPTAAKDIVLVPGDASDVMSAEKGKGAGLWVNLWGEKTEEMTDDDGKKVQKNKAITLFVPGSTQKDAVRYSTKLTWNLSDVPNNSEESKE
ncbi:WxL domain-containing protein [Lysinibacillus sp. NPDC093688]|uniref:WxL domain-containing protein n=1 Tax=Lysinibacillus sp. NPDC093688 TaxID=3390577 RepID=UPI003D08A00B